MNDYTFSLLSSLNDFFFSCRFSLHENVLVVSLSSLPIATSNFHEFGNMSSIHCKIYLQIWWLLFSHGCVGTL